MVKRSINNVTTQQINHTKIKLNKPQHNDQSSSDSTSKKSLPTLSNTDSPNKHSTTRTVSTTKRLNIFTKIYTPTKHDTHFIGIQTASIDSPNETAQPPQLSSHNITEPPNQIKGHRRVGIQKKQSTKDLPTKPKQRKMTGFGFKCAKNTSTHQKGIFTINENTIQSTLESLQESQKKRILRR